MKKTIKIVIIIILVLGFASIFLYFFNQSRGAVDQRYLLSSESSEKRRQYSDLLLTKIMQEPEEWTQEEIDEYKEKCKKFKFLEISRRPNDYKEEHAFFTGEVIQVLESENSIDLRVNITKLDYYWDDTIYVYYTKKSKDEDRILEDDIIKIYGQLKGLHTYESVLGGEITLPLLKAEIIEIVE